MTKADRSSISKVVHDFTSRKEEIGSGEVAAHLFERSVSDLGLNERNIQRSLIGRPVLWRGATQWARDLMKRPGMADEIMDEANRLARREARAQGDLFPGLAAFVRVDRDRAGAWRYKRRRSLNLDEYRASLSLLRSKHHDLAKKIKRYEADLERTLPHWRVGMTFGEAYLIAASNRKPRG